ncbi:MAG: methyltransferase domain-containing protein [Hyphomicrobiaceae bacterium]
MTSPLIDDWYIETLVCPRDKTELSFDGRALVSAAGRTYPVVDGIPVMLLDDEEQTMDIARASIERAKGNTDIIDQRAPQLYLESLAIGEPEKVLLIDLLNDRRTELDPVVSVILKATNGNAYSHLVGDSGLRRYPIPEIGLISQAREELLDVGCSWGRWCLSAAQRGFRAVGIDPSLGAIMAARRVAKQLGLDVRYLVADARYLPFRDGSFDVAHSYSVIQHFAKPNAQLAIDEMGRVLGPGGCAKVQMAHTLGLRSFQHQLRRRFREPVNFEVRYWTIGEMQDVFETKIGRTRITPDCFFGLGWQWSDFSLMPTRLKPVLATSTALVAASKFIPPLKHVADSLLCWAQKSGGTTGDISSAETRPMRSA